jgi:hypothetical protein
MQKTISPSIPFLIIICTVTQLHTHKKSLFDSIDQDKEMREIYVLTFHCLFIFCSPYRYYCNFRLQNACRILRGCIMHSIVLRTGS